MRVGDKSRFINIALVLTILLGTTITIAQAARDDIHFEGNAQGDCYILGGGYPPWNGETQESRFILVGKGRQGTGTTTIMKSRVTVKWTNGTHNFELDAALTSNEETKLAYSGSVSIGNMASNGRYTLGIEGSLKINGEEQDLTEWYAQILMWGKSGKYGNAGIVMRLYRPDPYHGVYGFFMQWGQSFGSKLCQVSING